jgi:hypothetical protein
LTTAQLEYLESQTRFDVGFPGNFIGPDPKVSDWQSIIPLGCQWCVFLSAVTHLYYVSRIDPILRKASFEVCV